MLPNVRVIANKSPLTMLNGRRKLGKFWKGGEGGVFVEQQLHVLTGNLHHELRTSMRISPKLKPQGRTAPRLCATR